MRVLHFIPSLSLKDGGTTTYMLQLAPALGKLCDLHVCILDTPASENVTSIAGATLHKIPGSLYQWREMRRQWLALLDTLFPDLFHVNCCWMPQCALLQFWFQSWDKRHHTERGERPVFLSPHGMLEPWIIKRHYWSRKFPAMLLYQRRAVRSVTSVITTAESEKDHLLALNWNTRVKTLPLGVDVDAMQMKKEWRHVHSLLFMSRIHPKKGLELLIKALAAMKDMPNCPHLNIVGDGDPDYVLSLKRMVETKGISQIVFFLGPVYGERKWQLLRDADLLVLPTYSENFGLVVAEALGVGTPVITTTGTPWRLLEEEACGWWISPSVEALHATLREVVSLDADQLEYKGRLGRRILSKRFSITEVAKKMYCFYEGEIAREGKN